MALIESCTPPLPAAASGVPGFTAGQLAGFTVTRALLLSTDGAHWPVTRTQYEVVADGPTTTIAKDSPLSGVNVFPLAPLYH